MSNSNSDHLVSDCVVRNLQAAAPEYTTAYELNAVYEFRPLPWNFRGEFRRYAGGEWIADDGEYDIAFIGRGAWHGAPICLYFEPAYQRNIIAGWLTGHWTSSVRAHPSGNPWHYALRDGTSEWGGDWGRGQHENRRAGDKGMSKMSGETGFSNGRLIEPTRPSNSGHIAAGLVRNRETKAVLVYPTSPVCMYCGEAYRIALPLTPNT